MSDDGKFTECERGLLWEAVNEYAAACGGDTGNATVGDRRMNAVCAVERAVRAIVNDTLEARRQ